MNICSYFKKSLVFTILTGALLFLSMPGQAARAKIGCLDIFNVLAHSNKASFSWIEHYLQFSSDFLTVPTLARANLDQYQEAQTHPPALWFQSASALDIVHLLSQRQDMSKILNQNLGNGRFLREHVVETLTLFDQIKQNFLLQKIATPSDIHLAGFLRALAAIQDIGLPTAIVQKSIAPSRDQAAFDLSSYSKMQVPFVLRALGFSEDERLLAVVLLNMPLLQKLHAGEITLLQAYQQLDYASNVAHLSPKDLLTVLTFRLAVSNSDEFKVIYDSSQFNLLRDLALGRASSEVHLLSNVELGKKLKAQTERQQTLFDSLIKSSGYQDLASIKKELSAHPEGRASLKYLNNTSAWRFAMNRPEASRNFILRGGFQNVQMTGLTKGASSFDGSVAIRDRVEASYLDMDVKDYIDQDLRLKPQYGYLTPPLEAREATTATQMGYGEDNWIFKPGRLEATTTFTIGDSLNQWQDKEHQGIVNSMSRELLPLTSWDQVYIPWKNHDIIALYLRFTPNGRPFVVPDALIRNMRSRFMLASQNYIELQIWKNLTLDNVEAFRFTQSPPTGDFLKILLAHGIKIFDKNLEEWTPMTLYNSE